MYAALNSVFLEFFSLFYRIDLIYAIIERGSVVQFAFESNQGNNELV